MTVLLHGFTGSPKSWARCPVPDGRPLALPGHAGEPVATSFGDAVDRIGRRLSPGGERIIGYSLGARIALGLAIERPERVTGLVLIGVNPGLTSEADRRARRRSDAEWVRILEEEGIDAFLSRWRAQPLFDTQRHLPEEILAEQEAVGRSHDPGALAGALGSMGLSEMPSYWPRLSELEIPVLLVTGERDAKFHTIAEAMLGHLKDGRHEVVPGAGHNPLLERPLELSRLLAPPA